jgi:hypothetical protein
MNDLLRAALPRLLPKTVEWAKDRADEISRNGIALDQHRLATARAVGVLRPELIRVALVDSIPLPSDPELQQAAFATGLLGPSTAGLTLGYGIYILRGRGSARLLSHECRHVFQYEQAGSIEAFLPIYLRQIIDHGYENAPYEIDARSHEIRS